jgi:hypothetical protein
MERNFDVTTNITYDHIFLKKEINNVVKSINLEESLQEIEIHESILSKLLLGHIIFKDIDRKFQQFLLTGDETIEISLISSQKFRFLIELSITSVEYIFDENIPEQLVKLTLKSPQYKLFTQEYSFAIRKPTLISTAVKTFANDNLNIALPLSNIESTVYSDTVPNHIVIPYLKPHYIFEYLNKYCNNKNHYLWLFFATLFDFNYKSLSYLYEGSVIDEYEEVNKSKSTYHPNYFSDWSFINPIDFETIMLSRGFGSTGYYFDVENKEIISKETTYDTIISNTKGLGVYAPFTKNMVLKDNYSSVNTLHTSIAYNNFQPEVYVLLKELEDGINININLTGILGRRCGQIVFLKFISYFIPENNFNTELTGNYLITGITHKFYPGKYYQSLLLHKTGIFNKYADSIKFNTINK